MFHNVGSRALLGTPNRARLPYRVPLTTVVYQNVAIAKTIGSVFTGVYDTVAHDPLKAFSSPSTIVAPANFARVRLIANTITQVNGLGGGGQIIWLNKNGSQIQSCLDDRCNNDSIVISTSILNVVKGDQFTVSIVNNGGAGSFSWSNNVTGFQKAWFAAEWWPY